YSQSQHYSLLSFPTRRSSDLSVTSRRRKPKPITTPAWRNRHSQHDSNETASDNTGAVQGSHQGASWARTSSVEKVAADHRPAERSEEHTSELQSRDNLVCRLL